ncbi:sensor histidine kinase [Tomitella gaofuii]|uniref:sensor histidine kinase n=1 Tax=Tomitella gaofuii TaxID=2760083 RepID=UPI0015FB3AEA|nr:sensor histidine kinase [Tomitella gaofuii]
MPDPGNAARSAVAGLPAPGARPAPVVDRYVLIAGHVLFTVLLVIGAVRAVAGGPLTATGPVAPLALAVATGGWYGAGAARIAGDATGRRSHAWLAGLLILWLALVAVSGEFIWLAFLLAMLVWHLAPARAAVPVDIGVALVAVVGFAWHQGEVQAGAVIGPAVGIASAVVMTEIYHRLRAQSEERRRLLEELVRTQAALADRERTAGRLAERERLAREIHDTVGQSLSSVILLLRAALADSALADSRITDIADGHADGAERAHEAHRVQLQTALDSTLAALGETRRLVRGLDPESIEKHGLRTALEALAEENRAMGVRTTFTEHGAPHPLPRRAEVALLRAAQEAVTNARKHADAVSVTITLTHQEDETSVDIVDDGRGFDAHTPRQRQPDGSGYGLAAMRARIGECSGSVVVESDEGRGTAVRATVPTIAAPDAQEG